jgi:predicted porin
MEKYMKKSLITLALMGALAPAFAQQSNVTVYGLVDAGVERTDIAGVKNTGVTSGAGWQSRIGFKGTEDLGNGVSAKFVLEQGFNVDTGMESTAGSAFSRQAWVGLSSNTLGEVRVGRQNSLVYEQVQAFDPFQIGLAGNALKFLGYGEYQQRVNNAVTYLAPSVGGFQGKVQYGFGETADQFGANSTFGLGGTYTTGPLALSLTRNQQKFNANGLVDAKATDTLLGATYSFSVAKAHFAYGQTKVEDNIGGTTDKLNNLLVGVSAPVGTGTLRASYIRSDIKDLDSGVSTQFAVGYTYPMSKRTMLYTSYAHVSNQDNVDLVSKVAGESANKFNVGVNHSF